MRTSREKVMLSATPRMTLILGMLGAVVLSLAACDIDPYELGGKPGWKLPDASTVDAGPKKDSSVDACVPTDEICDHQDNDCDGETDEDFDLSQDPSNCGDCGHACTYDHAFSSCENGVCAMGACLPGYWDNDGDESNGCEYSCLQTNGGQETCDHIDNDCDGLTDEDFDLDNDPANCGDCNRVCAFFRGEGACENGQCVLDHCASGYVDTDGNPDNGCECLIDATENPQAPTCEPDNNQCPGGEVCVDRDQDGTAHCAAIPPDTCDGVDNDCDGQTDEDATDGGPCYANLPGCVYDDTSQTWTCEGACHTGQVSCVGGTVQCTGIQGPEAESCDGIDNDCDGETDEDFDLLSDPRHCGGCNQSCTSANVPNAVPGCANGQCIVLACLPGYYDYDPNQPGCEYACTLTNGGVEACGDNIDNDCDGETDEGFDFQTDPQNCGSCRHACIFANASADCQAGQCVLVNCESGYWNADGDDSNGCEYQCAMSNGGVEICDGLDNDCNAVTDDGFDKDTDPSNCGSCGYDCTAHVPTGAQFSACQQGRCVYTCSTGHYDMNGDLALGDAGDGCEYPCTQSNGGMEICDGADNDCDGQTDEDASGAALTQACYTGPSGTEDRGICHGGTQTCTGGSWGPCVGEVTPEPVEQCDNTDHDCDGADLNGFDLTSDILNCGSCGTNCFDSPPANAYAVGCSSSTCQYACLSGYFNANNDWGDGCEYPCTQTASDGTEYCDGEDNDCDGQTDEAADLVPPPSGYCRTNAGTPCQGTTVTCRNGVLGTTWYCNYAPGIETDPANPNRVLAQETLCDDFDGNCDGVVDETFVHKGDPCDDGKAGACLGTGQLVCDATETGLICDITDPGASPTTEVCNGIDDDCNGIVDDNAQDTMVHIVANGLDFWMDAYEASRPDATATEIGTMSHRACSNPDVLPWYSVTWDQAAAACVAAGKRLCSEEEWQLACEGPNGYTFPYGNSYEPTFCNGQDYDPDCQAPDNDIVQPTGAPFGCPKPSDSLCISDFSVFDLSGNVMEWTATQASASPVTYRVRGGSYNNIEPALTCQFDFVSAAPDFYYDDLGFRCCSDTRPW